MHTSPVPSRHRHYSPSFHQYSPYPALFSPIFTLPCSIFTSIHPTLLYFHQYSPYPALFSPVFTLPCSIFTSIHPTLLYFHQYSPYPALFSPVFTLPCSIFTSIHPTLLYFHQYSPYPALFSPLFTLLCSIVSDFSDARIGGGDSFCDRLNCRFTVYILVIFALLITTKHYVGDPIGCWCPGELTRHERATQKHVSARGRHKSTSSPLGDDTLCTSPLGGSIIDAMHLSGCRLGYHCHGIHCRDWIFI